MKVRELINELEQYAQAHKGDDHLVLTVSYVYSDTITGLMVRSNCHEPYIELMGSSVYPEVKQ